MTLGEKELSFLDEHIPELADIVFKQAYWAALSSGSSVLIGISINSDEIEKDMQKYDFLDFDHY